MGWLTVGVHPVRVDYLDVEALVVDIASVLRFGIVFDLCDGLPCGFDVTLFLELDDKPNHCSPRLVPPDDDATARFVDVHADSLVVLTVHGPTHSDESLRMLKL